MKKLIISCAIILSAKLSFAQWSTVTGSTTNIYNTNTGSVGIGIGNTVPTSMLDIRKDQTSATVAKVRNLSSGAGAVARFDFETYTTNSFWRFGLYNNSGNPYVQYNAGSAVKNIYYDGPEFIWRNVAGTTTYLKITNTGSVGVGTATTGSFKLAVEGTIGTREIKVTSTNPWPDYVFRPGYALPKLGDLENYVQTNQHLPGIPSAEEIKKDGGVALGEMNRKLLEKVEELTLHIIQLNKRIEQLEQKEER